MMKKILNIVLKGLLLILALGFIWVAFNWSHVRAFPRIISSYYAKEFCSCYFVTKQSEQFCHDYTRQYIAISDFQLNKEKKTVTVSGLFFTNSAKFVNDVDGCIYTDVKDAKN